MIPSLDVLGYIAAIFSSFANVPQVITVLRNNETIEDVSMTTHVIFMISCFLWTIYSGISYQWPLLVNCVIVFVCNLIIFVRVLYSHHHRPRRHGTTSSDTIGTGSLE